MADLHILPQPHYNKITELSEFLRKKIGMATGSASAYNLVKAMSEKGLL